LGDAAPGNGLRLGHERWRRLRAWQEAGVWDRLHEVLLARLRTADKIDWSRCIVDSSSIRAVGAGQKQDPIPPIAHARLQAPPDHRSAGHSVGSHPDRRQSQRRNPTFALGRSHSTYSWQAGRPLSKPRIIQADRGYDHDKYRRPLHAQGIKTEIARRNTPHGSGLGKTRWVVERTIGWLHNYRRLRVRFERLAVIHEAFIKIACSLICWRKLKCAENSFC
jgi:transposase